MNKNKDKLFTVYIHKCENGKVYIGKTCQETKSRWESGSGYKEHEKFHEAIMEFGWDNIDHIVIAENLTKEEANALEVKLIEEHGGINDPMVFNEQSGGDSGYKLSDYNIEKMRKNGKERYEKHPELREERSKEMKARYENPEYYEKVKKINQELNSRPVNMYSKDWEYIRTYNSIIDAAKDLGIPKSTIGEVAAGRGLGKRKMAGGFIWRYADENKKYPIIQYKPVGKRVYQLDPDTRRIIQEFPNCTTAARELIPNCGQNVGRTIATAAAQGLKRYGFFWQYADDYEKEHSQNDNDEYLYQ